MCSWRNWHIDGESRRTVTASVALFTGLNYPATDTMINPIRIRAGSFHGNANFIGSLLISTRSP